MPDKIWIIRGKMWRQSRKLLIEKLGDYHDGHRAKLILNFGSDYSDDGVIVLNGKIRHIRDKIIMNKLLDEYGILHPKTFYYPFRALNILYNQQSECVLKKRFGSRGRGITFTTFNRLKIGKLDENDYVQFYIPFEREYRVCVDFKRVLGIREKIGDCKMKNSKTCSYITRHIDKLDKFALVITKQFKLDFTGIDIGEYNGNYYIIELNSAPTIGPAWTRKLRNDLVEMYKCHI